MQFPVKPVKFPTDLKGVQNGKVPMALMYAIAGGHLHKKAAQAFHCMVIAAKEDGVTLKPTSRADLYRSLARQESVFLRRFQLRKNSSPIVKEWKGQKWYLRSGVAPVAVPGTSNHGWGLAVDIAGASGKTLQWLLDNAFRFGFSWEAASGPYAEAWHIRYVSGDRPPLKVRRMLKKHPFPVKAA